MSVGGIEPSPSTEFPLSDEHITIIPSEKSRAMSLIIQICTFKTTTNSIYILAIRTWNFSELAENFRGKFCENSEEVTVAKVVTPASSVLIAIRPDHHTESVFLIIFPAVQVSTSKNRSVPFYSDQNIFRNLLCPTKITRKWEIIM